MFCIVLYLFLSLLRSQELVGLQTQGPGAESGPPRHFMWPLTAWKTYDHLFLTKKNLTFILKVSN